MLNSENEVIWTPEVGDKLLLLTADFELPPLAYVPSEIYANVSTAIDELTEETELLLVEASAPLFVRSEPIQNLGNSSLQFLPTGILQGSLTTLEDFHVFDPAEPGWQWMLLPFIGRLQRSGLAVDENLLNEQTAVSKSALLLDPVFNMYKRRSQGLVIPDLVLGFTSYTNNANLEIKLFVPDHILPAANKWAALDPTALEENWFRLLNPPTETLPNFLQSISAAYPDTAARLSRAAALSKAFDYRRQTYPPQSSTLDLPLYERMGTIVWRESSLLQNDHLRYQNFGENNLYAWSFYGLQFTDFLVDPQPVDTVAIYPATCMLPTPSLDFPPLSYTVSPYLNLDMKVAGADNSLRLVSVELLCLDSRAGQLLPTASRLWESDDDSTETDITQAIETWARETHQRLCADSPVIILRQREILENQEERPEEASVLINYQFLGLKPDTEQLIVQRVAGLRTAVTNLRFREGQFGGFQIPQQVKDFELAPPQVNGVQPIYYDKFQTGGEASLQEIAESQAWGLSTLRFNTTYTDQAKAVIGDFDPLQAEKRAVLWWQALPYFVQYRSDADERPQAGLPNLFRAKAIRSLLPVLPDIPLPAPEITATFGGEDIEEKWQSILPGKFRFLPLGARPGVPFVFRPHLQKQLIQHPNSIDRAEQVLVSGSVPVQHRFPRPVSLPPNEEGGQLLALQSWESFFNPTQNLYAAQDPYDTAFYAADETQPNIGLSVTLLYPRHGALNQDWDGLLRFKVEASADSGGVDKWQINEWSPEINTGQQILRFERVPDSDGTRPPSYAFQLISNSETAAELLSGFFSNQNSGDLLALDIKVRHEDRTEGFQQQLSFPVRINKERVSLLPFVPYFTLFEDPEYNRKLSSASGNSTVLVRLNDELVGMRLSTDRKVYNPNSIVAYRFDWDFPVTEGGEEATPDFEEENYTLTIKRVDPDSGIFEEIRTDTEITPKRLMELSLLELANFGSQAYKPWVAGEALSLELKGVIAIKVDESTTVNYDFQVVLTLDIVEEPIIPVPEAAYGLLRKRDESTGVSVECRRFSWQPNANRIELVNPDDLLAEIVRRRAVFKWQDTSRAGHAVVHRIQKITTNGSTHLPSFT